MTAPAVAKTPPEVTVDTGVLNSLGNAAPGSAHRVHLHPPRAEHHAKSAHKTAKKKSSHGRRQATRRRGHATRTARTKRDREQDTTVSRTQAAPAPGRATASKREAKRRHPATKLRRADIEPKTDLVPGTTPETPAKPAAAKPPASDLRKAVLAPAPALPPAPGTDADAAAAPSASEPATALNPPPKQPAPRVQPPVVKPAAIETQRAPAEHAAGHIDFVAGTTDLSPQARGALDAIAKTLGADTERRLQLVAYATGPNDEANQARRLSLSRALNVRAYLIDRGVRNTRMDVRALGNRFDDGKPADRVDILFVDK